MCTRDDGCHTDLALIARIREFQAGAAGIHGNLRVLIWSPFSVLIHVAWCFPTAIPPQTSPGSGGLPIPQGTDTGQISGQQWHRLTTDHC